MLEKGLTAVSRTTVTPQNTAAALGSGDMPVFATPAMVGATTVGAEMNVSHIKPSGLGTEVIASAVVTEVDERKITFTVGARDAEGLIGEGTHVRFVVDRARFLAKVR